MQSMWSMHASRAADLVLDMDGEGRRALRERHHHPWRPTAHPRSQCHIAKPTASARNTTPEHNRHALSPPHTTRSATAGAGR
eukprot:270573-Rhodomonas_salina.2